MLDLPCPNILVMFFHIPSEDAILLCEKCNVDTTSTYQGFDSDHAYESLTPMAYESLVRGLILVCQEREVICICCQVS
jgi:hypothetical protein